jgi:hypothetical protein
MGDDGKVSEKEGTTFCLVEVRHVERQNAEIQIVDFIISPSNLTLPNRNWRNLSYLT